MYGCNQKGLCINIISQWVQRRRKSTSCFYHAYECNYFRAKYPENDASQYVGFKAKRYYFKLLGVTLNNDNIKTMKWVGMLKNSS